MARPASGRVRHLGEDARIVLLATGFLTAALAGLLLTTQTAILMAVGGFCGFAAVLLVGAGRAGALRAFGEANGVTCIRAGLAAVLIGAVAEAQTALQAWWPVALTLAALILDGVDGALARRRGRATAFGALFDQEVDAALVLILTVLLTAAEKTGAWIVAAGLMRYILLLAGLAWPKLARPLPASRLRSAVCALLIGALAICLMPVIASSPAAAIAAGALLALTLSFGKDLIWLLKTEPENRKA